MADNYLEKKYEQYQARKTSGTRTSHNTKTLHKTRRVFITGGAEGIGRAIVRTFRGAGHARQAIEPCLCACPAIDLPRSEMQ